MGERPVGRGGPSSRKSGPGRTDGIFEIWRHADTSKVEAWSGRRSEEILEAFLDLILNGSTRERYPTNLSYPSWVDFKTKYVNDQSERALSLGLLPQIRTSRLRNLSFVVTSQGLLGLSPTCTALGESQILDKQRWQLANHHSRRLSLCFSWLPHASDSKTYRSRQWF